MFDYDVEASLIGGGVGVDVDFDATFELDCDNVECMAALPPMPREPLSPPVYDLPGGGDPYGGDPFNGSGPGAGPEPTDDGDGDEPCNLTPEEGIARAIAFQIANQPDSSSREYGAVIYQRADGSLYRGELQQGPATGGDVGLDMTPRAGDTVVGWVHNHPDGSGAPSENDWSEADYHVVNTAYVNDGLSMYIVTTDGEHTQVNEFDYSRDYRRDRPFSSGSDDVCN